MKKSLKTIIDFITGFWNRNGCLPPSYTSLFQQMTSIDYIQYLLFLEQNNPDILKFLIAIEHTGETASDENDTHPDPISQPREYIVNPVRPNLVEYA